MAKTEVTESERQNQIAAMGLTVGAQSMGAYAGPRLETVAGYRFGTPAGPGCCIGTFSVIFDDVQRRFPLSGFFVRFPSQS